MVAMIVCQERPAVKMPPLSLSKEGIMTAELSEHAQYGCLWPKVGRSQGSSAWKWKKIQLNDMKRCIFVKSKNLAFI